MLELVALVAKRRKYELFEVAYKHCESVASEEHKDKCREWLVLGYK
jgi:hypothetical protein